MHKKSLQRKAFFTLTNEGFSVHTFELSRQYTQRSWSAIKDRLYRELEQREPGEQAWSPKSGTGISARGMQDTAYESSWNTTPALPVRRPFLSA